MIEYKSKQKTPDATNIQSDNANGLKYFSSIF